MGQGVFAKLLLLPDRVSYPSDWPSYQQLTPLADNDNDGMADSYESSLGLNDALNDSAGDVDGDGYTNIEEYFYYLTNSEQADNTSPAAPSGLNVM